MPRGRQHRQLKTLILTEDLELPLLLTQEVPVNSHMRSAVIVLCLALVVTLLVNVRLEFERQRIGIIDGEPVYRYTWIRPWEQQTFLMPVAKPKEPYEEHYTVDSEEESQNKKFLTVWRVIRFGMQIYN